jgi:hypothetical protein
MTARAAWRPRPETWELLYSANHFLDAVRVSARLLRLDRQAGQAHRLALWREAAEPQLDNESRHKRDANGKPDYTRILELRNRESANKFIDALVALVCSAHPDALGEVRQ